MRRGRAVALVALAWAACGDGDEGGAGGTGQLGLFETQNAVGRAGAFYLPAGYAGEPLPLMVLFHGTNGDGARAARDFAARADADRFLIVAPDSRIAPDGQLAWEVGNAPLSRTADFNHAQALLDELEAREGVAVDWDRALVAGHSGGGAMAPYLGTNDARFDAFAVLHGGVVRGGIGVHVVPGWLSTGDGDALRPPEHVAGEAAYLSDDLGFPDITFRVYPGGHGIGALEAAELTAWWLALAPQ